MEYGKNTVEEFAKEICFQVKYGASESDIVYLIETWKKPVVDDIVSNYDRFVEFLKEYECYDEFMENYNKDSDNKCISLKQYCENTDKNGYISNAFLWGRNDDFWYVIEEKWIEELNK